MAHILKGAACFQIGSGTQVRVWHDPWLPYPAPHCPSLRVNSIIIDEETTVDSLILPFSRSWNISLICRLFCTKDAEVILNLHVPQGFFLFLVGG